MKLINPNNKFPFAEFTIAMGFFMLLTIEQIIADVRERNFAITRAETLPILGDSRVTDDDAPSEIVNHQNQAIRALAMTLALVIHSTFEGIAIGVQTTVDSVLQITGALIIHKIVISFSLGLTLSQSPLGTIKSAICGIIFAISSPLGNIIGKK
jgi:zinc transporter 1/2/3